LMAVHASPGMAAIAAFTAGSRRAVTEKYAPARMAAPMTAAL
jgi:predicted nicotinamide N-methyase